MVPDSLWIRNISASLEKWFSVESESLCEIVWPVCWNISNLVEMRRRWIRITWNTYFAISWLQYKNLKCFKLIHLWNVSIFPVWNCSKWFKHESETFHLAKQGLISWTCWVPTISLLNLPIFPLLLKPATQKEKMDWNSSMRSSRLRATIIDVPMVLWSLPQICFTESRHSP
jgi:hypothetical protein